MNMPSGRLIKHDRTKKCKSNMDMLCQRRDVAIASRCAEASFSLTGEDEEKLIKGVETFKYLGRMLDPLDDDWPAVRRNFGTSRRVWIRIGKLLRRDEAGP